MSITVKEGLFSNLKTLLVIRKGNIFVLLPRSAFERQEISFSF